MGSSPNVQLTLSLISSFCTPVLSYGIEAMRLNKTQNKSLSFPYNSGFIKLFEFYDLKTITQCQFYCGYLPLSYLFDLKRMNFYLLFNASHVNPASILFPWFGQSEVSDITSEYNISDTSNKSSIEKMIRKTSEQYCCRPIRLLGKSYLSKICIVY